MYEESVPESPVEQLVKNCSANTEMSRLELLREYEINIRFLSRGCIVKVGCKEIPFENVDEAMKALTSYVNNPLKEEEKWRKVFKE